MGNNNIFIRDNKKYIFKTYCKNQINAFLEKLKSLNENSALTEIYMCVLINVDCEGYLSQVYVDINQNLDTLRQQLNQAEYLFIDNDDQVSSTIYLKPQQQKLYQFSKDALVQLEMKNQEIEDLKKQLLEQKMYARNLETEIEKIKKIDDCDAKKQLFSNLNVNNEYYEEEEYKSQSDSLQKKFLNDKDYFKYVIMTPACSNQQKSSLNINSKILNLENNLIKKDSLQQQCEQQLYRSQHLEKVLYPSKKVKELTYEELQKRKIEHQVNIVRPRIENNLNKLEPQMRQMEFILKNKDQINMNKNYHITITQETVTRVQTQHNNTVCMSCNITCHENCTYTNEKSDCIAMQEEFCSVCPQRCALEQHQNKQYKIEKSLVTKVISVEDLRKIYCQTESDSLQSDQILLGLMKEFLITKKQIFDEIINLQTSINRFGNLLNRPNDISFIEIVESMIQNEKIVRKIGIQLRIRYLEELKNQFQNINQQQGELRQKEIDHQFNDYKQQLSTSSAPTISFSSQFQRKRPKVKNLTICKISSILERIQENFSAIPHYTFKKHKNIEFDLEEDLQKLKLTQDIYTQNNLVSIKEFLYKIQSNLKCTDEYFLAAFLLILKYLSLSSSQLTESNCQRLIACAIMLVEKQYSDYLLSLYSYSRGVNIPVRDLQEMELEFLSTLNWEINIKEEEFQAFQEYFNSLNA
ncbi:hypothetical protein ABPG72_022039 [Tetrahymena utriculariae]